MAMAIAREHGIALNEPDAAKDVEAIVAMWRNSREYLRMDAHKIPNPCMRAPDGQEFWNAGEYHEIVLHEKIVSSMYFSDPEGNKVEPAQYGIEHEAIDGAHDVITFEDFGNGQTKLTFIGNESMESAKNSGQVEGWNQILDKVAAVVAGLARAK
jgi:uncharacterized protein YndB with AHSA1/START domain